MFLGKMFLFYFQMCRKIIKRFDTFSETNHDIKDDIPVLMSEVNSHFAFLFFTILGFGLFIDNVKFDLKLFEFGRTEFFLFVF